MSIASTYIAMQKTLLLRTINRVSLPPERNSDSPAWQDASWGNMADRHKFIWQGQALG
jgi:hypothetical protein